MINHFVEWSGPEGPPITCLDFETTGREPTRGDKIVEIAAVRIEQMKIVGRWHTYVNPRRPIPDEASRVHGIYDEDVLLSPSFKDVARKFIEFCDGSVPCAYQESFDRGFAMAELWDAGIALDIPLLNWPCWLNPLAWVRSADRFVVSTDGSKVSNSLVAACERRGITVQGAHGAMADAEALALLVAALRTDMPRCTVSELLRRQPLISAAWDRRWHSAKLVGRIE